MMRIVLIGLRPGAGLARRFKHARLRPGSPRLAAGLGPGRQGAVPGTVDPSLRLG